MFHNSVLRTYVLGVLSLFVVGCAPNQPTPLPQVTAPVKVAITLPEMLAAPQQWSGRQVTLVAPAQTNEEERALVPDLQQPIADGDQTNRAIWLAQPLPAALQTALKDGEGVLKLEGTLSPPGAYGHEQRFTYQFVAEQVAVLQPERTTIANLAINPRALDEILLQLNGTLLARPDAALLADEVSEGGVPQADSQQIKLQRVQLSEELQRALKRNGDIQWGQVEVIGWWQDGALTTFSIVPNSSE